MLRDGSDEDVGTGPGPYASDGLVSVVSAELTLAFPETHQWIGLGMGHLDLLGRPETYDVLRSWLSDHRHIAPPYAPPVHDARRGGRPRRRSLPRLGAGLERRVRRTDGVRAGRTARERRRAEPDLDLELPA